MRPPPTWRGASRIALLQILSLVQPLFSGGYRQGPLAPEWLNLEDVDNRLGGDLGCGVDTTFPSFHSLSLPRYIADVSPIQQTKSM